MSDMAALAPARTLAADRAKVLVSVDFVRPDLPGAKLALPCLLFFSRFLCHVQPTSKG